MKKIIYAFIFALILFFVGINESNAQDKFNLLDGITYEDGTPLPALEFYVGTEYVHISSTVNKNRGYTWMTTTRDRKYEFIVFWNEDINGNSELAVLILADYGCYYWGGRCREYYYDYMIDDNDISFFTVDDRYDRYRLSNWSYRIQNRVNSKTADYTYAPESNYNLPTIYYVYDEENKRWESETLSRVISCVYVNKFLYSTRDLYLRSENSNGDYEYDLWIEGKKFVNTPDVSAMNYIELNDIYSVVFKPKYESITDTSDLKFIFKNDTISSYKHYQNYDILLEQTFTNKWEKFNIDYANLDLDLKTDTLEFFRNTEVVNDETSSSGFQHGGGGRHLDYDSENNTLINSEMKTGYIYYYADYFDYCIKYYDSSQCYYKDGTIENSYFTNSESTDDYIKNLISYFKEQNQYFLAFGAILKYAFYSLSGEIRTFIIATVIIFLIYGFISLIRRR